MGVFNSICLLQYATGVYWNDSLFVGDVMPGKYQPIDMGIDRTVFIGDNLDVMRGFDDNSVDLIYLDPPFNSNKDYEAPIGSEAAGAAFKDTWTLQDIDIAAVGLLADEYPGVYALCNSAKEVHSDSMYSYLAMMASRLVEMKRVLRHTGSIYLHCDPTANSYLRLLMDAIFGKNSLRNELVWCYPPTGRYPKQGFPKKHDTILFYSNEDATFHPQYTEMTEATLKTYSSVDEDGRKYSKAHGKRTYLDQQKGRPVPSWWTDMGSGSTMPKKERVGYPTQKPLALLKRIILASSNQADVVLDPFCGCATACVAAEELQRKWIGIDISPLAGHLVRQRIKSDLHKKILVRDDIPTRKGAEDLPSYKTHKHSLYGKQEGNCKGCEIHFPFRNMTVDHLIPKSKGGDDRFANLQLLCGACNSKKGDRSMEYLIVELKKEGLLPSYATVDKIALIEAGGEW